MERAWPIGYYLHDTAQTVKSLQGEAAKRMRVHLFRPITGRMAAALLLCGAASAAAAQDTPAPRSTSLGAGYEWTDVKYAVKSAEDSIDGYKIEAGLGVLDWLHLYGEYFDGDYAFNNSDLTGFHAGFGFNFAFAGSWDVVARVAYVDTEIDGVSPSGSNFVLDDDGYAFEGLVRGMVSDRTEINVGYLYTDLDESGNSNSDVTIGINFDVTDWATVKARGIVFGNDTGVEFGVRFYVGDELFGSSDD